MVDIDPSDVGQSLPKGSVVRHSKTRVSMTAMGQSRRFHDVRDMSGLAIVAYLRTVPSLSQTEGTTYFSSIFSAALQSFSGSRSPLLPCFRPKG
jgi:hypothetical protein